MNGVRRRWKHARHLHLAVKTHQPEEANATRGPSPIGAFAALLVEWKLTQARENGDEVATRQSA